VVQLGLAGKVTLPVCSRVPPPPPPPSITVSAEGVQGRVAGHDDLADDAAAGGRGPARLPRAAHRGGDQQRLLWPRVPCVRPSRPARVRRQGRRAVPPQREAAHQHPQRGPHPTPMRSRGGGGGGGGAARGGPGWSARAPRPPPPPPPPPPPAPRRGGGGGGGGGGPLCDRVYLRGAHAC
jgi:hypothetical protein